MKSKYGKSVFEINVLKTISQMQNLCYVFKHIKIKNYTFQLKMIYNHIKIHIQVSHWKHGKV